jgi:HAD superfamily phosphatase (TIGR01668 family)
MLRRYAHVERIEHISLDALWNDGYRGLILDLDNTLLAYGSTELTDDRLLWVQAAQKCGFKLVILSNNFPERVHSLGRALDIQAIPNALKPMPFAFFRALQILAIPRQQCLVIGDQLLTDHLGAAVFRIGGILTEPIVQRDFPLTRVLRFIERRLLKRQKPKRP